MARYIDAEEFEYAILHEDIEVAKCQYKDYESYINGANQFRFQMKNAIRKQPAADVVEVVRCKDCIHKTVTVDGEYDPEDIVCGYHMSDGFCDNDYCSYGKLKELGK